jgi:hypothetical protein
LLKYSLSAIYFSIKRPSIYSIGDRKLYVFLSFTPWWLCDRVLGYRATRSWDHCTRWPNDWTATVSQLLAKVKNQKNTTRCHYMNFFLVNSLAIKIALIYCMRFHILDEREASPINHIVYNLHFFKTFTEGALGNICTLYLSSQVILV